VVIQAVIPEAGEILRVVIQQVVIPPEIQLMACRRRRCCRWRLCEW
jgi:hypothetical protein